VNAFLTLTLAVIISGSTANIRTAAQDLISVAITLDAPIGGKLMNGIWLLRGRYRTFAVRASPEDRTSATVGSVARPVLGIRLCRSRAALTPTAVQLRLHRRRATLDDVVRFRPDATGFLQRINAEQPFAG